MAQPFEDFQVRLDKLMPKDVTKSLQTVAKSVERSVGAGDPTMLINVSDAVTLIAAASLWLQSTRK